MQDALSFYEQPNTLPPVSIISIPTELGSDARGLAKNPAYLRAHGLGEMFAGIGANVASEIEIPCPEPPVHVEGPLKNLATVTDVATRTAQAVRVARERGEAVVALGGDHSSAIGTLCGASLAHPTLGVIWIDAHPDVQTPQTTQTHNVHGMPAALAMGFGHQSLVGERNVVKSENFLFVGLKDFDQAEIDFLRREQPPVYTMLDITQHGLAPVFKSISALSQRVKNIWVSMDMDAVDQRFAPGVAMPNTAGLSAREALALAQYIGKTCHVAGLDIVEMLPTNDVDGKTAGLALELIARFLGSEYSWYKKYMTRYEK